MLFDLIEEIPNAELTVDLEAQTLTLPNGSVKFPIDPFNKTCLLNGVAQCSTAAWKAGGNVAAASARCMAAA